MEPNKLIVAGGSGFLGKGIVDHFRNLFSEVVVLTRGPGKTDGNVRYIQWDGETIGSWSDEIDGSDVVINLTGKSVDCRYTDRNKAEIISSRVNATKVIGEAIQNAKHPPKLWFNAASATIYRHAEDRAMDEFHGEMGTGFSVSVCREWEKALNDTFLKNTHKIILRISMVMGRNGGVFPVMKKLVKRGLGGKMGNGEQYISWIHEEDFLRILGRLMQDEKSEGVYNIAAPEPIRNKDFMRLMRRHLRVPFGLPAPSWMLEVGAFFIRTETELILKSRRVIPARLLKEGFEFKFPNADSAIKDLSNA